MASNDLIDRYVNGLVGRLPTDTVDELADGLIETWHDHLARGLSSDAAARAAIAEFGDADRITDEFVACAPGRRTARVLLAASPFVGAFWGASVITAKIWTWPIPVPVAAVYAAALIAVVVALVAAATSKHSYRRAQLGTVGALGLVVLDATALMTVAAMAPTLLWPMAVAVAASLARIALTIRGLPRAIAG